MEKTGSDPAQKFRWFLFAGAVLLAALLTTGGYLIQRSLLTHRQAREKARKEAFCRADKLALYSSIGFLEEQRRQSIAELVAETGEWTNVNAALVHLFAESRMSHPVSVSNFAGSDAFVDPWGLPYEFTIATNAGTPRTLGRQVERRITIESGHHP